MYQPMTPSDSSYRTTWRRRREVRLELARAVVDRLADVVLERHPGERDLDGVLAGQVDRRAAPRLGERRPRDLERAEGRSRAGPGSDAFPKTKVDVGPRSRRESP